MIGHNNGIVDDDPERDGNTCQGIEMDLKLEEIIKNKGNENIGDKADGYY